MGKFLTPSHSAWLVGDNLKLCALPAACQKEHTKKRDEEVEMSQLVGCLLCTQRPAFSSRNILIKASYGDIRLLPQFCGSKDSLISGWLTGQAH